MWDLNTIAAKVDREVLPRPRRRAPAPEDPKQRKLMLGSLCLLLLALGIVLWRNSDFWFPPSQEDAQEAESEQPVEGLPANKIAPVQAPSTNAKHGVPAKGKQRAAAVGVKPPEI